MALYDNLFEPLKVGPTELKNRIVRSAHSTGLGGEGLIAYHEARAKGGVAMSTIQATGVHHSAPQESRFIRTAANRFLLRSLTEFGHMA